MLCDRYHRTKNIDDFQAALSFFTDSYNLVCAMPLRRVQAARNALRILATMEEWNQASLLAKAAIELLPFVCDRYLSRDDQQYAILQISGLASDACSLSLRNGNVNQALQQLEFGRGVILGYLMDGRSDLTELQKDYSSLANEYDALRFKAYAPIESKELSVREQLGKERKEATRDLEDCLNRIRQKHGFQRFLLEPALDELKQCANQGPIVMVNATDFGCDAIIVSSSEVRTIELPEMHSSQAPLFFQQSLGRYRTINQDRLKEYERDIDVVTEETHDWMWSDKADVGHMSWLWSCCVQPILKELKDSQAPDSHGLLRVWWIGTGIASGFPFHAAGHYVKDSPNSDNTLSQIIPSYTSTIKALSFARSCASKVATNKGNETSILVVTMPTTPGHKSLPGVDLEKVAIQQMTRDFCKIKVLESPTAAHVLEDISAFDVVHFACHGCADLEDPSNSHLLLQKSGLSGPAVDELTVSDISKRDTLGRKWIAYLSACSTAGVEAKNLADECLHLASAFQVAGFAHVIGSLWPADDDVCVRLAECFYRSLTKLGTKHSNRAVAEALRSAVLDIRLDSPDPRLWAPFIHSGA